MKRCSQIIVLMDVMFIFLFILIIKPEKNKYIPVIDNQINITDTKIIAIYKNSVFFLEDGKWVDKNISFTELKKMKFLEKSKGKFFTIKERNDIISKLPKTSTQFKILTLVYGDLYNDIVAYGFIKCTIYNRCFQNTEIHIKGNGSFIFIDKKQETNKSP